MLAILITLRFSSFKVVKKIMWSNKSEMRVTTTKRQSYWMTGTKVKNSTVQTVTSAKRFFLVIFHFTTKPLSDNLSSRLAETTKFVKTRMISRQMKKKEQRRQRRPAQAEWVQSSRKEGEKVVVRQILLYAGSDTYAESIDYTVECAWLELQQFKIVAHVKKRGFIIIKTCSIQVRYHNYY